MADGDVPNINSVASLIPCVHTRYCVQFLITGMVANQQNGESILSTLNGIAGDISEMKQRDASSARLWPLPPAMINAVSHDSSSSSQLPCSSSSSMFNTSKSSSSNSRKRARKVVLEDHPVWVKCPFCHKQHWNEKSHVQHIDRSLKQ